MPSDLSVSDLETYRIYVVWNQQLISLVVPILLLVGDVGVYPMSSTFERRLKRRPCSRRRIFCRGADPRSENILHHFRAQCSRQTDRLFLNDITDKRGHYA